MNIHSLFLTHSLVGKPQEKLAPKLNPQNTTINPPKVEEKSTHSPSSQLSKLLELVRNTPEVREDRLAQVAHLLASGFYFTPDAAEQAASTMIESSKLG